MNDDPPLSDEARDRMTLHAGDFEIIEPPADDDDPEPEQPPAA